MLPAVSPAAGRGIALDSPLGHGAPPGQPGNRRLHWV